jgi:hypothetical protein
MTNQIYLVQLLPYENWETIAHFDNYADADAFCDKKIEAANNNPLLVANYRVHAVANTPENKPKVSA